MKLEVHTPVKQLFSSEEIKLVKLPGSKGSFEILKDHAPIVSYLEKGVVKIIEKNNLEHFIEIDGGVVECKKNNIVLLADAGKVVSEEK